jgi:hypothetical protein
LPLRLSAIFRELRVLAQDLRIVQFNPFAMSRELRTLYFQVRPMRFNLRPPGFDLRAMFPELLALAFQFRALCFDRLIPSLLPYLYPSSSCLDGLHMSGDHLLGCAKLCFHPQPSDVERLLSCAKTLHFRPQSLRINDKCAEELARVMRQGNCSAAFCDAESDIVKKRIFLRAYVWISVKIEDRVEICPRPALLSPPVFNVMG